jgi:hypothetical protein
LYGSVWQEQEAIAAKLQQAENFDLQPSAVEFTARDLPQYNSQAEKAFPHLAGMAPAAMSHANVPWDDCPKIAVEVLSTVTLLNGLSTIDFNGVTTTRDIVIYGANPKWASNLCTIGEAVVVNEGKDGKTGDHGVTVMFVGYPPNRTRDTNHFWKEATNFDIESRDTIWLGRMYFDCNDQPVLLTDHDDVIKDPGDQLAADDGSDSDDKPNSSGVVKHVHSQMLSTQPLKKPMLMKLQHWGVLQMFLMQLQQQLRLGQVGSAEFQ